MQEVTLTCVACGLTEDVVDTAEALRDRHCAGCGASMVQDQQPGSVQREGQHGAVPTHEESPGPRR